MTLLEMEMDARRASDARYGMAATCNTQLWERWAALVVSSNEWKALADALAAERALRGGGAVIGDFATCKKCGSCTDRVGCYSISFGATCLDCLDKEEEAFGKPGRVVEL